eukprot:Rmarinus@m.17638
MSATNLKRQKQRVWSKGLIKQYMNDLGSEESEVLPQRKNPKLSDVPAGADDESEDDAAEASFATAVSHFSDDDKNDGGSKPGGEAAATVGPSAEKPRGTRRASVFADGSGSTVPTNVPYYQGWLRKNRMQKGEKSFFSKDWNDRYFVLDSGALSYYQKGPKPGSKVDPRAPQYEIRKGVMDLDGASVTVGPTNLDIKGHLLGVKACMNGDGVKSNMDASNGWRSTAHHERAKTILEEDDDNASPPTLDDGDSDLPGAKGFELTVDPEALLHHVRKEGWGKKKGQSTSLGSGWKDRYFVLEHGRLAYYGKGPTETSPPTELKDMIFLKNATIEDGVDGKNKKNVELRFTIITEEGRQLAIEARTAKEKMEWLKAIDTAITETTEITTNKMTHLAGYLRKKGHSTSVGSGWKNRYFVLSNGRLAYFESDPPLEIKGVLNLAGCEVTPVDHGKGNVSLRFTVKNVLRTQDPATRKLSLMAEGSEQSKDDDDTGAQVHWLELEANSAEEVAVWTTAIEKGIMEANVAEAYLNNVSLDTIQTKKTVRTHARGGIKELQAGWVYILIGGEIGQKRKVPWQKIYMVLTTQALSYYASPERVDCRGIIELRYAIVQECPSKAYGHILSLRSGERVLHLMWPEENDYRVWSEDLQDACETLHSRYNMFSHEHIDVTIGDVRNTVLRIPIESTREPAAEKDDEDVVVLMTVAQLRQRLREKLNQQQVKLNFEFHKYNLFEIVVKDGKPLMERMLHGCELVRSLPQAWEHDYRLIHGRTHMTEKNRIYLELKQIPPPHLHFTLSSRGRELETAAPSLRDWENWTYLLYCCIEKRKREVASRTKCGLIGDDDKTSILEGWLWKEGHGVKSWKERYVVLTPRHLSYYRVPEECPGRPLGRIPLSMCTVTRPKEAKRFEHCFRITVAGVEGNEDGGLVHTKYIMAAETPEVVETWMCAIEAMECLRPVKQGWLYKEGHAGVRTLKKRWFVLKRGTMTYAKEEGGAPFGIIPMNGATLSVSKSCPKSFCDSVEIQIMKLPTSVAGASKTHKRYTIAAKNPGELRAWVDAITSACTNVDVAQLGQSPLTTNFSKKPRGDPSAGVSFADLQDEVTGVDLADAAEEANAKARSYSLCPSVLPKLHERLARTGHSLDFDFLPEGKRRTVRWTVDDHPPPPSATVSERAMSLLNPASLSSTLRSQRPFDTAIVVDNGSNFIRAGFAGEEIPRSILKNPMYDAWNRQIVDGGRKSVIAGGWQWAEDGPLVDLDKMEALWDAMFYQELSIDPDEYPVLLTEMRGMTRRDRGTLTELMFEAYDVQSLYLAQPTQTALYATGSTTGVVVDLGTGCSIVPIAEGVAINHASYHSRAVGGVQLSSYLSRLLSESGYYFSDGSRTSLDSIEYLKRQTIVCTPCPKKIDSSRSVVVPLASGEKTFRLRGELEQSTEVLFDPSLNGAEDTGLTEAVRNVIANCAMDLRKDLYRNVVLVGGTSCIEGLAERLQSDLCQSAGPLSPVVNVRAKQHRKYLPWIGASVFTSICFQQDNAEMWFASKDEYEELGSSALLEKFS